MAEPRPFLLRMARKLGRFLRRNVGRIVFWFLFGVFVLLSLLWAVIQSPWAVDVAMNKGLPIANDALPGEIHVGSWDGALGDRLVLQDVEILDELGEPAVAATRVEIDWNIWDLLALNLRADRVRVHGGDVVLRVRPDKGGVNLANAFVKPRAGPRKKKKGKGIALAIDDVDVYETKFAIELPTGRRLAVEDVELHAAWSMQGAAQDVAIGSLDVTLVEPRALPPVHVSGGARMAADLTLDVDALTVLWEGADLGITGSLGDVRDLQPDLEVRIRSLDLAAARHVAAKAPLEGDVTGELKVTGRLKESMFATGQLRFADGAALDVREVRLALPGGERAVIEHDLDVGLVSLSPDYFLDGIDGLPDDLTADLAWEGRGTNLDTLAGTLRATGAPFEFAGLRLGPVDVDASLDGPVITTRRFSVGFGGGTLHVAGTTDVEQQSFAMDVDGLVADLGALRSLTRGAVTGGSYEFDGFTRGTWGGDGPYPLSLHSTMTSTTQGLDVGPATIGDATADWDIDLDIVTGGLPLVRGTFNTVAHRVRVAGREQARQVRAGLLLQGAGAQFTSRSSRGADLLVDATGFVRWEDLPTIAVRGDEVTVLAGDQVLQTSGPFTVDLTSGALALDGLELQTESGRLALSASRDPRTSSLGAELSLQGQDLAEVEPLVTVLLDREEPLDHGLVGRVKSLDVTVDGTLADPLVTVAGTFQGVSAFGRPPQALELDVKAIDGLVSGFVTVKNLVTLQIGRVPLDLTLDGSAPPVVIPPHDTWDLGLEFPRRTLADLAEIAGVELPEGFAQGEHYGDLELRGPIDNLYVRTVLHASGFELADRTVHLQAGAIIQDGQLEVSASRLKLGRDSVLRLSGEAGAPVGDFLLTRLGPQEMRSRQPVPFLTGLKLELALAQLPMMLVHEFVPALKPLTGAAAGKVKMTGELSAPIIDADVQLVGARAGKQDLHPLQLSADVSRGQLTGGFKIQPKRGGSLKVNGGAPFPLSLSPLTPIDELLGQPGLDVTIAGDGFPLPVLLAFVPDIWESRGTVSVNGTVTGSLSSPIPEVSAGIDDGLLCYKTTGVCYEEVNLTSRLQPDGLELTDLSFVTAPQVLNPIDLARSGRARVAGQRHGFRASGTVALDGFRPGALDLTIDFERMWAMYTAEIKAQLHGGLRLTGELPALDLRGELELSNVDVDLGSEDVNARSVQPVTLPDNLHVHRTTSTPGPGERVVLVVKDEDDEPSYLRQLMDASYLDVTVVLTNNIHVAVNYGLGGASEAGQAFSLLGNVKPELNLEGEVNIKLRDGKPYLEGEIRTGPDSQLTVLTRRFLVSDSSSVTFAGLVPDTQLNLTALFPSNYGDVEVLVRKRLGSPEIEFRSDQIEDQADIMSVLITGKPLSELGSAEGSGATAAIVQALAGMTTKAFGKYLPVDRLNVDLGDDISSGSVEAGKAITPYIFFIARYNWGVDDDENRVEGELEIRIARRAYIEFRIGDRLDGSAEVVWKLIF